MILRPRALGLAAALLALGLLVAPARAGSGHQVDISGFAFVPPALTIDVGDTVTWTNLDQVVHTATSTTGAFDSGDLANGESYSLTFTTAGTYDYLCTPHPEMTGQIVVRAPAPAATPAPPGTIPNAAAEADGGDPAIARWLALALLSVLALATARRSRAVA